MASLYPIDFLGAELIAEREVECKVAPYDYQPVWRAKQKGSSIGIVYGYKYGTQYGNAVWWVFADQAAPNGFFYVKHDPSRLKVSSETLKNAEEKAKERNPNGGSGGLFGDLTFPNVFEPITEAVKKIANGLLWGASIYGAFIGGRQVVRIYKQSKFYRKNKKKNVSNN